MFSTKNLCCNMTISLSPSSYCILASKVAHSVSNKFPLALTVSAEKSPIQRNPETIRCSSAGEEKTASLVTAAMRVLYTQIDRWSVMARHHSVVQNLRLRVVLGAQSLGGNVVLRENKGNISPESMRAFE